MNLGNKLAIAFASVSIGILFVCSPMPSQLSCVSSPSALLSLIFLRYTPITKIVSIKITKENLNVVKNL